MTFKYALIIFTVLFSSNSMSKNHYKVEKTKNSKYIGKVYNIKKPVVYIENLSRCNSLDKYTALNSSCLFINKSQYTIKEIEHNCTGCLSKKTMHTPLRVKLKESVKLTVVDEYSVSINYLSYKFFGGSEPHKILLLIDQNGNYIESPAYDFDSDSSFTNNKISRESNEILAIKATPQIVKKICYYKAISTDFEENKGRILKMLSEFNLSHSIKVSDTLCNRQGMSEKGIALSTNNFDDFFTFYYFKGEWGIYGEMY